VSRDVRERLRTAGKPLTAALTAGMRQLLTILEAVMRHDKVSATRIALTHAPQVVPIDGRGRPRDLERHPFDLRQKLDRHDRGERCPPLERAEAESVVGPESVDDNFGLREALL
jgi:hypothetical protein